MKNAQTIKIISALLGIIIDKSAFIFKLILYAVVVLLNQEKLSVAQENTCGKTVATLGDLCLINEQGLSSNEKHAQKPASQWIFSSRNILPVEIEKYQVLARGIVNSVGIHHFDDQALIDDWPERLYDPTGKNGVTLDGLTRYSIGKNLIFVNRDGSGPTLFGRPVQFICGRNQESAVGEWPSGRRCRLLHPIAANIAVRYSFFDHHWPQSEWHNLVADLGNFIQSRVCCVTP